MSDAGPRFASAWCLWSLLAVGCVDTSKERVGPPQIVVDVDEVRAEVPPSAYGLHSSVYDNALHDPALGAELEAAGIGLLRWPGGGYSDNYHWSNHSMTRFFDGSPGYLAEATDFGSYARLTGELGVSVMITVNYGSNLSGTGAGEPKEAAAWVAYANGDPDDDQSIGVDGSGEDWQTVGAWASLRASDPLDQDDGQNFLRISHPEPLDIEYWEIGNEVFGNGYHGGGPGYELDLHLPYDGTLRQGNEALSGRTYGRGVRDYIDAMKAVDPGIQVGAVLNTPPEDYDWGPDWNRQVIAECGEIIDFAIVHWYPASSASGLLRAPGATIPVMVDELRMAFETLAPAQAPRIELAMTELGPGVEGGALSPLSQARGLFATDSYLSLLEHGFFNVDWLELHNGSFLSERGPARGPAFPGIQLAHRLAAPGDALVQTTSNRDRIVAHAARRSDGTLGILVINTMTPEDDAEPTSVLLEMASGDLFRVRERFDYAPGPDGESGVVEGPSQVSDLGDPPRIAVEPYQAVLLVFEPS